MRSKFKEDESNWYFNTSDIEIIKDKIKNTFNVSLDEDYHRRYTIQLKNGQDFSIYIDTAGEWSIYEKNALGKCILETKKEYIKTLDLALKEINKLINS